MTSFRKHLATTERPGHVYDVAIKSDQDTVSLHYLHRRNDFVIYKTLTNLSFTNIQATIYLSKLSFLCTVQEYRYR